MSRAPTISTISIGVMLAVVLVVAGTFNGPWRAQDVLACSSTVATMGWCWVGERRIEQMASIGDWHAVARASGIHFGGLMLGTLATFVAAAWHTR
jgi:hypothetical protein